MAATAILPSADIQHLAEDQSLPKPWKGLVDGQTGYLYYWNTETNVTQYEKPVIIMIPSSSAGPNKSLSPSVQTTFRGHVINVDYDVTKGGSRSGSMMFAPGTGSYQSDKSGLDQSLGMVSFSSTITESADSYRQQHDITVSGINVPLPFTSFEATGFPSEILREVVHAGFSVPTPIQAQSWPIAQQGSDVVAIAKTGSGKTLGYLIPGFTHIMHQRNNPKPGPKLGPTVLVLSPTRELATQIQAEVAKFGKSSRITCTCLYGGAPKGPQLRDLDRGVDVVVATPGRLNDILEMRRVNLRQVSYLVLDEADRMLDMGFEPQIKKIVKEVPTSRQTLMYTATWPKVVRRIAADLLVKPVQINIGKVDELAANKSITQFVEVLAPMDKHRRLEQILRSQEPGARIIIFCATKKMCDQLARNLTRQFEVAAIHGDKSQGERDYVLNQFRLGRSPVLVATDVAARGLDVKDIQVVVNFDFPMGIEDYVHRIGRTGRAGASGQAFTFFSDKDAKHASALVKVLTGANQNVPAEIHNMASRGGNGMGRQWGSSRPNQRGGRWGGGGGRDTGFGRGGYGGARRSRSPPRNFV
ncbi:unnamed protein product [Cuscuta epithymum]|uniref:RNA helicase n=2 Tax=Cuscuta epithymum TaxID=186058 RepID=A0AAV0EAX6_9ASTE|nr:unnamed protein product [Cuscuta epithymum]CAH9119116.1 unnamed protein product [Cuscuta epithymum]